MKRFVHLRLFYHVMTVDRCAEVGSPWFPWPCDFTLDGSSVRSGPGKEAARPETATRPAASLPFPRAPDPLSARPLHSRPRRYLFYGPLTFTAAKITLRLQTTTVLGRHYKIISSCIFWARNLQPFWKLNQNCYLLQLLFQLQLVIGMSLQIVEWVLAFEFLFGWFGITELQQIMTL